MDAGGTSAEAAHPSLSARPKAEIPSVDWWMTSHCNLACDFCYGPVPGKDPVERRAGILEALAASSARVVTFCGGEPLLVRKIDQYAATLAQRGKSTVLNTNGQLLRRRLDQGFRLASFAMVGISIEGSTPEIHRAMRGKKADLDEVIEAARLVTKEPDVALKLATVVSGVNRDNLPALARTVRDLAPDIWRLYQYSSRGELNVGQQRHWLPEEDFRRLVKRLGSWPHPCRRRRPPKPKRKAASSSTRPGTFCNRPAPSTSAAETAWRNRWTTSGRNPGAVDDYQQQTLALCPRLTIVEAAEAEIDWRVLVRFRKPGEGPHEHPEAVPRSRAIALD